MNKWMGIGRLVAKPELRYNNSNISYTRFTLAVNKNFTNENGEREADFINIVAWRKQAETICNYFDKGNQIAIEGRIQTGSYDDKDGNKRYTTDVILEQFHFIESKKTRENQDIDLHNQRSDYIEDDPFATFGSAVSIEDDNYLE